MRKICTKCKQEKESILFKKDKERIDGLSSWCKLCNSKATCLKVDRIRANKNNRNYKKTKKGKIANSNYKKRYPYKIFANTRKRQINKLKAIPLWADLNGINDIYQEARYQGLHVDHIIPLQGRNVCGLHWEWNLQLLTPFENCSKGNRHA